MPKLTEQEQQEVIRYIEAGSPYRKSTAFCCLTTSAKRNSTRTVRTNEVTNVVLPFPMIEQMDEHASIKTILKCRIIAS